MLTGQPPTTPPEPSPFILSLPKAELHLHLEGSIGPEELAELILRHDGGPVDRQRLQLLYQHLDFAAFLENFKRITHWLRTPEDYEFITYRLMQKLAAEGVLHAEVYVSVGVCLWRGLDFGPIFEGLERGRQRGRRDFGVSLLWIFDATRHFGPEPAQRVAELAVEFRERNVVGFGIGGDERRAAPELFRDVYAYARRHGLRLTAHAGEDSGPQSILGALDALRAERIGHGLTAIQDRELLARLVRDQVPVEICLSSNLRTGCCPALPQHPLKTYFDLGLLLTLNTDDPAMFGTTLAREYQLAQDTFGFTDAQLRRLAVNSFRASFLPEDKKQGFLEMLAD